MKSGLLLFFLWIAPLAMANTAEIQPKAVCNKREVKIGEPFQISLFLDYPSGMQILFPDSAFPFGNSVLRERKFFPTRSSAEMSRDCVVFALAGFIPDSVQIFRLPVMVPGNSDTLFYYAPEIQVRMRSELPPAREKNPRFEEEIRPAAIDFRLNYPYILTGAAVILALLFFINFFFDKPIQKFFYLWIEQRRHLRFLKAFARREQLLESELNIQQMEAIIILWKRYLQRVEGKPYITYTSLEINRLLADQNLKKVLQEIDRWIYGGMPVENMKLCIQRLRDKSVELYEKKRSLIRSGKSGIQF